MAIEHIDPTGIASYALCEDLKARIEELRLSLEQDHNPETTSNIRGRISELRELMAKIRDTGI